MEVTIWWRTIHAHDDYIGNHLRTYQDFYEKDFLEFSYEKLKGRKWLVIDVGANIWNHSVYRAMKWFVVESFEPSRDNFKILEENAKDLTITPLQIALSDRKMKYHVEKHEWNRGMDRIVEWWDWLTLRLDSLRKVREDEPIILIKIDVEWHESNVIRWWLETIKKYRPDLMVEINDPKTDNLIQDMWYKKLYARPGNKNLYYWFMK